MSRRRAVFLCLLGTIVFILEPRPVSGQGSVKRVVTKPRFLPGPFAGGQSLAATQSLLLPSETGKSAFSEPVRNVSAKAKTVKSACSGSTCVAGLRRPTRPLAVTRSTVVGNSTTTKRAATKQKSKSKKVSTLKPKAGQPIPAADDEFDVVTVYPVEPTSFAFRVDSGDPVADSSGTCEGVDSKVLAAEYKLAFVVAELEGWCESRARDASIIIRIDREAHPDWAALQPNAYWREYFPSVGRSALSHRAEDDSEFAGVNTFIDGGRTFEVHVATGGIERAAAIANWLSEKVTKLDPVATSSGLCGQVDAKKVASVLNKPVVLGGDQSALNGQFCWLIVDNYSAHLFVSTENATDEDDLAPNAYFSEFEAGLGRRAVYHAPLVTQPPIPSYHAFQILKDPLNLVIMIDAPDRGSANAAASSILKAVGG
jgi:hypothetical protein